ncbi:transcription elongation factor GreA [Candidatus Falkowbacteria bacterium]|nr:transcription elongation factor GreA [Candidatus Falkowbacteria bacterium]
MNEQIISQEGYDKLKNELETLIKIKRPEIARRIQTAKDMGDLSENAEYSDAKEAQAFNEGRIAELDATLKNVTVMNNHESREEVSLGSVVIAKIDGKSKEYTIVSFNEADPLEGKISNESPLGRALLHKRPGDTVTVKTPKGEAKYEIVEIR